MADGPDAGATAVGPLVDDGSAHCGTVPARVGTSAIPVAVEGTDLPRHHRCNLCGKDFERERRSRDHVERRHPGRDYHWRAVVEAPARDLRFSGES